MNRAGWDERYATSELVWSRGPNQFLVEQVADLPAGRALDLACGEGRNAIWLATSGWDATGVDFSPVGIEKARTLASGTDTTAAVREAAGSLTFEVGDATTWTGDGEGFDLVIVFYLHLVPGQRRAAHRRAADAVRPGGTLLVVGHDLDNLERGVGGPQDPTILLTADDVVADVDGLGLEVEQAGQVFREVDVDGSTRTAVDCLVRAVKPPR